MWGAHMRAPFGRFANRTYMLKISTRNADFQRILYEGRLGCRDASAKFFKKSTQVI